jgi:hypothetical protein
MTNTRRRLLEAPSALEREIAQEALDRVDGDGAVELTAVAAALARVVADPTVDGGEGIVCDQRAPRLFVPAGLDVREPRLDVLARRAGLVAGRQQVHVLRALHAHRSRPRSAVREVGQRREVPWGGDVRWRRAGRGRRPCRSGPALGSLKLP